MFRPRWSKVIDTEGDICEEPNTKYQKKFKLEGSEVPLQPVREGVDTLENIEINPMEVRRLIK